MEVCGLKKELTPSNNDSGSSIVAAAVSHSSNVSSS